MTKVYFISGGNRGIGFGLTKQLAARDNVHIIATARDPDSASALKELQAKHGNIDIVKLDVSSEESIDLLDAQLKALKVSKIDTLISNAGIADAFYPVVEAPRPIWPKHFQTNTLGPIFLFTVLAPYLEKGDSKQVVFISSAVGSIAQPVPFTTSAYGLSKAALNYVSKTLSIEWKDKGFTVVAIHPGAVSTDMGTASIAQLSPETKAVFAKIVISPEESVTLQLKIYDALTTADNGKFLSYDGSEIPW